MNETVNRLAVETRHGARDFRLVRGDVSAESADLLVFSASAGLGRPTGGVLRAVEKRHGRLAMDRAEPILSFAGRSAFRLAEAVTHADSPAGTYLVEAPATGGFAYLLLVRLPGSRQFGDRDAASDAYGNVVRGTFASLAALEVAGKRFRTVALPILGGARRYPKLRVMRVLLESALDWLRNSRCTERVAVTVYDHADVRDWSRAMDEVLGRTYAEGDYSDAASELGARLREQVDALLEEENNPVLMDILAQIRVAAANPPAVSIQHFGLLGRLLAEAISGRLCTDLGLSPGDSTFGNIEKIGGSGAVSKWIGSYLHCLRILGNESVHLADQEVRVPKTLATGDLVVIFGNMLRVLDFYGLWSQRRG